MSPTTPRPAASLILLRDAAAGLEVLVGRRRAAALAFPGAVAFPGGKLEPGDLEAEQSANAAMRPSLAPPGAAFAALRETFEETGLWLSAEGSGAARFPDEPGLSRLVPYAHWITPATRSYRFDTWFFLAVATQAEAATTLAGDEFEALAWSTPSRVLADHATALLPPTRHSLKRLAQQNASCAALADAEAGSPFDPGDFELRGNE